MSLLKNKKAPLSGAARFTFISKFGLVSLILVAMAWVIISPSELIIAQPLLPDDSSSSSSISSPIKAPATLSIGNDLSATAGSTVDVPIMLTSNDNQIVSAGFDVGFDAQQLSFDPSDSDEDGIPDAITFHVPNGLLQIATFDEETNELAVVITDLSLPFSVLSDGAIMTVGLQVSESVSACASSATLTLTDVSLGDTKGQSVEVITGDGEVSISSKNGCQIYLPIIVE